MKIAYCTGFWCTNIGNGFFSLGVEYVLKKILGEKNVTVVSDYQTYTTSYGKRLYIDKNQMEYISSLDVDYIVLAGPVISRYFLYLWSEILRKLKKRGIGYMILSAGIMKLNEKEKQDIIEFFKECPPYIISSRDQSTYKQFSEYAVHAYNGICFSFFSPDYYTPARMDAISPYIVFNFDKINEPVIKISEYNRFGVKQFEFDGSKYQIINPKWLTKLTAKTDRFTDAIIYLDSMLPTKTRSDYLGKYRIIRTDHRFHPHFRKKIYKQHNSFVADLPYGYINLYANTELTLSDRVHACAVTLAFGHSAMLFAKTDRCGLLERVGAEGVCNGPVKLNMDMLETEKKRMIEWLENTINGEKTK